MLQFAVTDYPKTEHTGTLAVKLRGQDAPLLLNARSTPSTLSHHFGNSLTDYVFLASVPEPGQPSFIAVVTRDLVELTPSSSDELAVPVGYLIRTDAEGQSSFALLDPAAKKESGGFDLGAHLLGCKLDVRVTGEAGQVLLNDGQLPAKTGFGTVTITPFALLDALRLTHPITFSNVVIDVTGRFIQQTGRGA